MCTASLGLELPSRTRGVSPIALRMSWKSIGLAQAAEGGPKLIRGNRSIADFRARGQSGAFPLSFGETPYLLGFRTTGLSEESQPVAGATAPRFLASRS